MKKTGWAFLITLLCAFFLPTAAKALQIFPARQTAVVQPGETQQFALALTNDTLDTREFRSRVSSFQIEEKTYTLRFDTQDPAINWMKSEVPSLTLAPGAVGQFTFTFSPPPTAAPGAHYLVLFAEEVGAEGQVALGGRVGSLLFLNIAGEVRESAEILDFSSQHEFYFRDTPQLHLLLANTGNIHLVPRGAMSVSNFRGHIIMTESLNPTEQKVLAEGRWQKEFPLSLSWKDIGKIQVRQTLYYGIQEQIVTADTTFWYLPLWPLLGGGSGIILILTLVIIFFRKKKL